MVVRQTLAIHGYKREGSSYRLGGTEREARRVCRATIPCPLLPEAFGGAEEVTEGTGELAGLLKEVQVEVGHSYVLLG